MLDCCLKKYNKLASSLDFYKRFPVLLVFIDSPKKELKNTRGYDLLFFFGSGQPVWIC